MSFDLGSAVVGYMIGSSSYDDKKSSAISIGGSISFSYILLIIFNFAILYFFGDTIFDLCRLSFFIEDIENIKFVSPIPEAYTKLMMNVLPIIPISIATSFPIYLYRIYQHKKDEGTL